MAKIQAKAGQIIGRDHLLRQANCQDSYALFQSEKTTIGVVCDGCGSGSRSEVGATLTARFAVNMIARFLSDGVGLSCLPHMLKPEIIGYLDSVVKLSQPINPHQFIEDHLLFTLIGVVAQANESIIFAAGDGAIVIDEQIITLEQNNTPDYIAYHLIENLTPPQNFEVFMTKNWHRLAIMTDGFETELLPQVWKQTHPRGLQRQMNVWSNQEKRFRDDATILALEHKAVL